MWARVIVYDRCRCHMKNCYYYQEAVVAVRPTNVQSPLADCVQLWRTYVEIIGGDELLQH